MFTGIIEELGAVKGVSTQSDGRRLTIAVKIVLDGMKIGDSIAVNGGCLTVVETGNAAFSADVSRETVERTNLGRLRVGDKVNLERAMMLSDRLGGHLVAGHVDALGIIRTIIKRGNGIVFTFEAPPEIIKYLIHKGSVAVDGISLTVNEATGRRFSTTVIPHTARATTLGLKHVGDTVNLEADQIGKYIERFLGAARLTSINGWASNS